MAFLNKQVREVLRAWRANEIGPDIAAQRLVGLGWNAEEASTFLENY